MRNHFTSTLPILCLLTLSLARLEGQTPEWIWHDNKGVAPADDEERFFRRTFSVAGPVQRAILTAAGDDRAIVFLNGKRVAINRGWNQAVTTVVTSDLRPGENVLAIRGQNSSGDAAVIARLEVTLANNRKEQIVTDATWLSATSDAPGWQVLAFNATGWNRAVSRGKLGVQPWGDVMAARLATSASAIRTLPGFSIELIRSSEPGEGTWICLAVDHRGRLIISPQDDRQPLLRITLTDQGQVAKIDPVPAPVRQAMGMLYAHDSLYVNGHGPQGTGLYRLIDANQNDQFDTNEVRLLKNFRGEGEHGYHAVVLGPDQQIYVMNGNHTRLPDGISPQSPHRNFAEDLLLARQWDGGGHAVGILAPGGHILRTDPDGKNWELVLAGFRNAYDFDFNADGEIFTFDSDMEWDWGMPWYRPTRVNHCVSGSESGWRSGSGKWPDYYPDSLPAAVDIGIGSPTGVKFGTRSRYPARYQQALYILDWSYGRIIAVHLKPQGATYTGSYESFVQGKPLNVSDIEFGNDGAMYFITGGRGTQSGLYRVAYRGPGIRDTAPNPEEQQAARQAAGARALRRKLEAFHGKKDPAAIDFAWPHLNSDDRWIRYAARIALESQDVALWKDRALDETRPTASLTALLALARVAAREYEDEILQSLDQLNPRRVTEAQLLEALRVLSITFTRARLAELGPNPPGNMTSRLVPLPKPVADWVPEVIDRLDPLFPSPSEKLNRELVQLLIYLEAPGIVQKSLALMESGATQEEQIHYLFHLRNLKTGWTMDQRRRYFEWFHRDRSGLKRPPQLVQWFADVGRDYTDGASFPKFLNNIRKDAVAALTDAQRAELALVIAGQTVDLSQKPAPREFVREWKMEDLLPALEEVSQGRSFERGRKAFVDAQCLACHRFGDAGGSVGPDLTAVSSRFTRRDILESTLDPSKVLSEQYQNIRLFLKDGEDVTGRILNETDQMIEVLVNPLTQTRAEVRKADLARREPSKISPMPQGLVNVLTKEDILDLLAYMESGGKPSAAAFAR